MSTASISVPKANHSMNSTTVLGTIHDVDVRSPIGRGKFGEVFKGFWKGSIEVALKKMISNNDLEIEKEAETLRYIHFSM